MNRKRAVTRGTAGEYWADTAEGQFESMSSTYQPGEQAEAGSAARRMRAPLPPLTASRDILDAIAACAQPRETVKAPAVAMTPTTALAPRVATVTAE